MAIVIKPTPGVITTEQILELIERSPAGITVRKISQKFNRPVRKGVDLSQGAGETEPSILSV